MADVVEVDLATGETVARSFTAEEKAQRTADLAAGTERDNTRKAEDANDSTIVGRLETSLDQMRAHVARGSFTAAQRDAALLLCLRVCIGLVRRSLRRLDGTD